MLYLLLLSNLPLRSTFCFVLGTLRSSEALELLMIASGFDTYLLFLAGVIDYGCLISSLLNHDLLIYRSVMLALIECKSMFTFPTYSY